MDRLDIDRRISQITTHWSAVAQAHGGPADSAAASRGRLLQRYGAAAYRYLLGALRDQDAADELFQEFALRFLRGDFRRADPGRGRFRDYLKASLFRLVVDHNRYRWRRAQGLPDDLAEPDGSETHPGDDPLFQAIWREDLLERCWQALAEVERTTGRPLHTVLRLRADQPEMRAPQMAEHLSARLGQVLTPEVVRRRLQTAREVFADCLVAQVASSLDAPTAEELESELSELGLLDACRAALRRRRV